MFSTVSAKPRCRIASPCRASAASRTNKAPERVSRKARNAPPPRRRDGAATSGPHPAMAEFEALRAAYAAGSDADSSLPARSSRRVISVATTCCRTELAGSRETAFVVPGDHGLRGVARQAMQPSTPVCFGRFATGQVKYITNAADILTKSKTKSLAERIFLADHRKLKSVDQFDHRTMVADGSAQELGVSGF